MKDKTAPMRALRDVADVPHGVYADGLDGIKSSNRKRSGSHARKDVIVALAKRANPDGTSAYPSINTLVEATGIVRSSVQLALSDLERLGFLSIRSKQGMCVRTEQGIGKTNLYVLNLALILQKHQEWKSKRGGWPDFVSGDGPISSTGSPDSSTQDGPILAEGSPDSDGRSPDYIGHNRPYDRPSKPPKSEPPVVDRRNAATTTPPFLLEEEADSDERYPDIQKLDDAALTQEIQRIARENCAPPFWNNHLPEMIKILRSDLSFSLLAFDHALEKAWHECDKERAASVTFFSEDFYKTLKARLQAAVEDLKDDSQRSACFRVVDVLERDLHAKSGTVFQFTPNDRKAMCQIFQYHGLDCESFVRGLIESFYDGIDPFEESDRIGESFVQYTKDHLEQMEQSTQKADESQRLAEKEYWRASIARQKAEPPTATIERAA